MATITFVPPILPAPPKDDIWSANLIKQLTDTFRDINNLMMPKTGVGRFSTQTLGDNFTISQDGLIVLLDSGSAVTSNDIVAIKNGQLGSLLILINMGSNNITIKNNANTKIGADITLQPFGSLMMAWCRTTWVRIASQETN